MIGKTIAGFRIVDRIGQGGMGVVYRAEDQRLGRSVALKFLPPGLTSDEAARARFLNEARAASALDHRNVCVVHDIAETEDGQLYIVMPFYPGESLQSRIQRGPLPPAEAVEVLAQIGSGLVKAHERGILHRDLKPANVLLTADGEVKILDFGVAKLGDGTRLTRSGVIVGTLCYMAPEQLREEEPPDVRAEIWSLGVLLFEMLTGEPPFRGRSQGAVVTAILHHPPELKAVRAAAGDALAGIVDRCLRRRAGDRYASVAELLADLDRVRSAELPASSATAVFLTPANTPSRSFAPPSTGGLTPQPFVARDDELAALLGHLEATLERGARVALVRGEEGRGKSALLAELGRRAEQGDRFVYVAGSCNQHGAARDPYLPFREILSQLAGTLAGQDAAGQRTQAHVVRIERLVPDVAAEIVEQGPLLVGSFVSGHELIERGRAASGPPPAWLQAVEELVRAHTRGGDRDADRSELFEQYTRVLQRVARRQPLVLALEDLHWADSGTAALLSHLARSLGGSPVLLLGSYRAEEVAFLPGRERHPLEPVVHEVVRLFGNVEIDLDRTDGERFVTELLDAQPNRLDESFRTRLIAQTGGLPLFTTELLRELRDAEVLVRDAEGRWNLAGDVDWDMVPRRVEALVSERVARLPDELRALLTTASVQGEEFTAEIVARVLGRDERDTVRLLSNDAARRFRIVAATGVRRIGAQRLSLYRFQHAVFQRYLYETLDEVERALQHEDTAAQIEAMFGDREEEVVAQLAHHYLHAGVVDKAIECLRRAGARAASLSAHTEAMRCFETALEQLSGLPEGRGRQQRELELRMALVAVQIAVHGFASAPVESTYLRARSLAERLPEASGFALLWGLFAFSAVRGEFQRALPLARRMLESSGADAAALQRVQSHYAVGVSELFTGGLAAALEHLQAATEPRDPELGKELSLTFSQDTRKVAAAYTALVRWLVGDARKALAAADDALAWAREDAHPFTSSTVLLLTGFVRFFAGDAERVRAHGEEMARLSRQFELFQATEAELLMGLAEVAAGAAPARLAQAVAAYRQRGWTVFVPMLLGIEGRARLAAGERERAAELMAEAWTLVEQGGDSYWAAELLILRADLSDSAAAAALARRKAVEIARQQGAGWLELRAALAAARAEGDRAGLATTLARLDPACGLAELSEASALLA